MIFDFFYKNYNYSKKHFIFGPSGSGKTLLSVNLVKNIIKSKSINISNIYIFTEELNNNNKYIWKSFIPTANYYYINQYPDINLFFNKGLIIFDDCIESSSSKLYISNILNQIYSDIDVITTSRDVNIQKYFLDIYNIFFILNFNDISKLCKLFNKLINSNLMTIGTFINNINNLNLYKYSSFVVDKLNYQNYNYYVFLNNISFQENVEISDECPDFDLESICSTESMSDVFSLWGNNVPIYQNDEYNLEIKPYPELELEENIKTTRILNPDDIDVIVIII